MSYYDYDEEPMYEPMPEFLEKIHELVNEQIKTGRVEMVEEMERLKAENKETYAKNRQLSNQVSNTASEIKKQVDAARKEFEREMFGGFLIGDIFYRPAFTWETTNCPVCNGGGLIAATIGTGETVSVKCIGAHCEGGKIKKGLYEPREGKVINVKLYRSERDKDRITIYYRRDYDTYDCDHTECFKTKEEAQVHCDKRTEKYRKENEEKRR